MIIIQQSWYLTMYTEISQDLQRSHKYILHLIFELSHLTFYIDMTFDIYWDLTRSTEISQDLLRSHKIYWDLTRYIEISKDILIWHLTCLDIWHLTFHIWHLISDIWHLKFGIWHLTFDIWHLTLKLHDMIMAQTSFIFTDGFWGYISNLKTFSRSVTILI